MISICVIYCCIVFSLPDISITCIFFCDVRGSICFLALPHLVKQQKQYTNELSCSELVSWPFQCTLQLFARSWPYPNFQIWERSGCVGGLSAAHVWNITVCDFPFFFFFVSLPRLQIATVGRFLRSVNQTTHFRANKCLLVVSMMNFHIYPLFSSKMWKFALRPMATSNGSNSSIFKDRSNILVPKVGFSGSGNLTASSKFASDRPLLPWQPTDGFWTQN